MQPQEAAQLFANALVPWWIAGGWAIDLHVGRRTREHEDLDVLVLRPHLPDLRRCLDGWDLHEADPPGALRPWPSDERLPAHVADVWCRRTPNHPWSLQLMIDETSPDGRTWLYRRAPNLQRQWTGLRGPASRPGRLVLAPEIQLLYKSFNPRLKDQADFNALLPQLDPDRRRVPVVVL